MGQQVGHGGGDATLAPPGARSRWRKSAPPAPGRLFGSDDGFGGDFSDDEYSDRSVAYDDADAPPGFDPKELADKETSAAAPRPRGKGGLRNQQKSRPEDQDWGDPDGDGDERGTRPERKRAGKGSAR